MEQDAPLGMSWGVLSVDGSEEHWRATLGHRESIKERVRWVGRDPGWWDRLDVERLPQVVVVKPNGDCSLRCLGDAGYLPPEMVSV